MPHTLISLPTYTTAAMAHDLLAARQIRSEITRTFAGRHSSCGYSIKIDSRYMPEAQYLLSESEFPILKISQKNL